MIRRLIRGALVLTMLVLLDPLLTAQVPGTGSSFSKEQLEQMVAPVALYPDNLITAVLIAATYPLEIVEADRWLEKNKDLKDAALETALKDQNWDPATKSIVMVPDVLHRMSENLDWTRDLGDAFLGQKAELMDAVQRMRGKANEAGNLKTTEQQTVTVNQDQTIVIEPTNTEICYVPEYGTAVYGGGWAYPEPYYPYMYPAGWGLVGFGAGLVVGGALWGNANWGWGSGDIDIDINRSNNWNNRVNNNWQNNNNRNWNHRPEHRKGVNYRDNGTAGRYGGAGGTRVPSDRARGRPSQLPAGGNRPGAGAGGGQRPGGDRPGAGGGGQRPGGDRPGAGGGGQRPGGDRPGAGGGGQRPSGGGGAAQRPSGGARPAQQPSRGGYSGSSKPRADRASSQRGNSSRGSYSGGSRGGGGGGRGGARGGGGGRGGGGRGGRR